MHYGLTQAQILDAVAQLRSERRECCWNRKVRLVVFSSLSLLASMTFFVASGYLIWTTVERTAVLFLMAAFFVAETLYFGKYWVNMLMLRRDKLTWHTGWVWFPMTDLVSVLIATFAESLLLPCGALADLWNQFSTLESLYYWLLVQSLATLAVKLITAISLTVLHYRGIMRLARATMRIDDPDNFPHTREIVPSVSTERESINPRELALGVEVHSMQEADNLPDIEMTPMHRLADVFRPPPTAPREDE